MANTLALGLVIGGAVSATVGAAFKDVDSRIKQLAERGNKAKVLQSTIGETMRLRDEFKKAYESGAANANKLGDRLEANLATLKKQGVQISKLRKEFQSLGQVARGAELTALGHSQVKAGKEGMRGSLGKAAATTAAFAIPTKISGDYQAQIRQIATWAHTAGTEDETKLANAISEVAGAKGMSQQALAQAVGGLVEKGVDWEEAAGYAGQIADLIDGQGMEAETIATLINSFKEAGVKQQDMGAMLGQVAAAGDIGAFGPKEMARYLPAMLGNIKRLGMEGPEAVRFLGASLQSQYSQTQDAASAATNMNNLLNAVISSTSQERFAKEGYDLAGSILAATKSGKAANPVDAFIMLSEQLLKKQDPAKAKKVEALKAKIKASKDGSAEEEQSMVALIEAAGLANIVSDQSASAGLLAQIKYGDKIKGDMTTIKETDGQAKIEGDAAMARETSNRKWAAATAGMEASMIRIGDAIRPLTDRVADGLASLGNGLGNLAGRFPVVVSGAALLAAGVAGLGVAVNALKIGKGLLNIGRGTMMGDPKLIQRVFVTNAPAAGGADLGGSKGKGSRRSRGGGMSVGSVVKGSAVVAVVDAGFKAVDTYQNAETRDEKAEGYGNAAGSLAGTLAGAAAGAAIGSVVPVIGTVVGGLIGGFLGGWGGGEAGGAIGKGLFGGPDEPEKTAADPGKTTASLGGPQLGDVSRSLVVPSSGAQGKTLLGPVPLPPPPPKVEQTLSFSPTLSFQVQGDVKDPQQLANEMMPRLRQLMEEFNQQAARRNLYDAPHV